MSLPFRAGRFVALPALLLCFSWCSGVAKVGGSPPPAAQPQSHGVQSHTVVISGFKFQPDVLTVHVGDTIEWKNADIVPHTVTAVDRSFNSGGIAPGAKWKFVAKKAGTFPYACLPHPNMRAKLIVQ